MRSKCPAVGLTFLYRVYIHVYPFLHVSCDVSCDHQEKEASYGAPVPRILSIDTYFMNEVEKVEKDPDTGNLNINIFTPMK